MTSITAVDKTDQRRPVFVEPPRVLSHPGGIAGTGESTIRPAIAEESPVSKSADSKSSDPRPTVISLGNVEFTLSTKLRISSPKGPLLNELLLTAERSGHCAASIHLVVYEDHISLVKIYTDSAPLNSDQTLSLAGKGVLCLLRMAAKLSQEHGQRGDIFIYDLSSNDWFNFFLDLGVMRGMKGKTHTHKMEVLPKKTGRKSDPLLLPQSSAFNAIQTIRETGRDYLPLRNGAGEEPDLVPDG